MIKAEYVEEKLEKMGAHFEMGIALFVTATDIETKETHRNMTYLDGYQGIIQVYEGAHTYFIGKFGNYIIAHVQCAMGSVGRDSSITTVMKAVDTLKPKFVIMPGIAFGLDRKSQNIGDVLISEGVIPYENERIGNTVTPRAQNAPSSKVLLNRFKTCRTWEFILEQDVIAKQIPTQILSGEKLVDNIQFRDELVKKHPHAKGGEMEGAGVFAACDGNVDWIIVKGICDYADGKKSVNKETNQETAIKSSISLCKELFSTKTAFAELSYFPVESNKDLPSVLKTSIVNEILFDIYDKKYECFYVERKIDSDFEQNRTQFCIWVHGISGCGKTNLLYRNLLFNDSYIIEIGLGACIDCDVLDIFKEIYIELGNILGHATISTKGMQFPQLNKALINLLQQAKFNHDVTIVVDEIPVSEDKKFRLFVQYMYSLLITKQTKPDLAHVKFVFSSINNPKQHIDTHQYKIHNQLKFIYLDNWDRSDSLKLVELISNSLKINMENKLKENIYENSKGSPRFIKKYFRNILATAATTTDQLEALLTETTLELR